MIVNRRRFCGLLAAGATVPAPLPNAAVASRIGDPWLEVDRANLAWNLQQISAQVKGKPVMAVVKANAYGHGLEGVAQALQAAGVNHFLVAKLDEARRLRRAGIRGAVFHFGPFQQADVEEIIRLKICQNIYTDQFELLDRCANRLGQRALVQIKVDTGLGRLGVHHQRALEFVERVAARPNIKIEGVLTTFSEDPEFDAVQLARFREICARAAERRVPLGRRHAASSAAILDLPPSYSELDMVRPGIMLYGLYPSERAEQQRKLDLRPVLALKTRVACVKTLRPGESVSYHRVYTAQQLERVATLWAGYADGLPQALAGKGSVLVRGRPCPILAISANATIVRLGDIPAELGEEATLIGAQGRGRITVSELARLAGSSVYGVVMGLSGLLPQVIV